MMDFLTGLWCGMVLMGAAVFGLALWLSNQLPRVTTKQDEVRQLERMVGL